MGNSRKITRTGPKGRPLRPEVPARGPGPVASVRFNSYDPTLSLNQNMRRSCNKCGGPVEWVGIDVVRGRGMPVEELSAAYGCPPEELDYWVCGDCDNTGAFGPARSS